MLTFIIIVAIAAAIAYVIIKNKKQILEKQLDLEGKKTIPDSELIKSFPDEFEFTSSWYVKMRQGGHISGHIHEIGWISGAVYLQMPKNKKTPEEGGFETRAGASSHARSGCQRDSGHRSPSALDENNPRARFGFYDPEAFQFQP